MDFSRRQLHLVYPEGFRGQESGDRGSPPGLGLGTPRLSGRLSALEVPLVAQHDIDAEVGHPPGPDSPPFPPSPPTHHNPARARAHWRFVARNVTKLMPRVAGAEDDDDAHSLLSQRRMQWRGAAHDSRAIARSFVETLAGSLGTGAVLQQYSAAHATPAGAWAPLADARCVASMLASSWFNLLLVAAPLGAAAGLAGWSPTIVFVANFLALIPLALLLGETTEDLAIRFGDTIGGLLNATFGNVVELILSIAALQKGLFTVVATSLIGSILSNLLLVLGMCFLFGGLKYQTQKFSTLANKASSFLSVGTSLLFLACIGIIIPTMARQVYGSDIVTAGTVLNLSHAIAILLIFVYLCYLMFQLKTHKDLFASEESEDQPALSLAGALLVLSTITIIVAICSEYLTGSIEAVSERFDINPSFLGLIILPIAGNACEHITAVFVAMKNKMDLAIGVAVGSSIQIALFVIPFTVLAGWAMGASFTLDFDVFSVLMLTTSVILAYFVSSDGSSNWLLGLQLVITYLLIAAVFLLEREPKNAGGAPGPSSGGAGL